MTTDRRRFLKKAGIGLSVLSVGLERLVLGDEPKPRTTEALRAPTGHAISKVEWFKFSTPRPYRGTRTT
jgi:hypothetical protein